MLNPNQPPEAPGQARGSGNAINTNLQSLPFICDPVPCNPLPCGESQP